MVTKKEDLDSTSYTLGILSIVMAFFLPIAGLIIGIIGLIQSKKQSTLLSKRAKKLNTIGIILSIVVYLLVIMVTYYIARGIGSPLIPIA